MAIIKMLCKRLQISHHWGNPLIQGTLEAYLINLMKTGVKDVASGIGWPYKIIIISLSINVRLSACVMFFVSGFVILLDCQDVLSVLAAVFQPNITALFVSEIAFPVVQAALSSRN